MTANFIHLRVHTSYSLSEGALKIPEITKLCKTHKMPAICIADKGNLFGSLEFSSSCANEGIQPIIGCEINVSLEDKITNTSQSNNNMGQIRQIQEVSGKILLIAQNKTGYQNLLSLVSRSFLESQNHNNPKIRLQDLSANAEGIIVLTGGTFGLIGKIIQAKGYKTAADTLNRLKQSFPNRLYIELHRFGLEEEKQTESAFLEMAQDFELPLVATNDVYFSNKEMFEAAEVLLCIAGGRYLVEDNREKHSPEQYFKSEKQMMELFSDIPEAIQNTVHIAKRCAVMAEERKPLLPKFPTIGGRSEEEELRDLATAGLNKRLEIEVYPADISESEKQGLADPYRKRLEYELSVILKMEYPGYFLIVSDFIRWSKQNDIPVGPGRGSGAGSVVAWALEITDLDPLRFGLIFERFLNPDRISMPDFDIDFCQEKRDKVIEYVRDKYGNDKVAQIITFGKLQARAVLRDVGRVLQMPYNEVDKICKMIPFNPVNPITLSQAIELDPVLKKTRDEEEDVAKLLDIGLKLEGLHRHASTHAAGIVIADRPLTELVPLYLDPRSSMPVIQYSMKLAEAAGLVKFDFLGLKTLTIIQHTIKLIENQEGTSETVDIPISYDNKKAYEMISKGRTVGVFQLESAGMRDALRKMKPDKIEDIIALISLYRPGPMDNIPTYIARKHGQEKPDYIHPMLEETLKETFGVIIYQEQVIKIAQVLAGYSLGAADLLRRAMGKKNVQEMDAQREKFVSGAVENGVEKEKAAHIFDLVAKFAGYGFNKSHAAAYAIISYKTAFLKANYPVEFIVASMNLDIGDTDKLSLFRQEAINNGIKILPPDINHSSAYFTVEKDKDGNKQIRYGLAALKNVGTAAMENMALERQTNGVFKDIFDFAERNDSKVITKRQIEGLAKSNGFASIADNMKQIFDSANILTKYSAAAKKEREGNQISLFGNDETNINLHKPVLTSTEDWDNGEKMVNELEVFGFFIFSHPLNAFKHDLKKMEVIDIADLEIYLDSISQSKKIKLAGVVTHTTHRAANKRRFTYLQFSDPTGVIEISVFDENLISESRDLVESKQPLLITVDARRDEGGVRLTATGIESLEDALKSQINNFRIYLSKQIDFAMLNSVITDLPKGRDRINLIITTSNQMEVEIESANLVALNENDITRIQNIDGIKEAVRT